MLQNVAKLIALRTSHQALQRDEIELFYLHPQFDTDAGARVFGYARPGEWRLGEEGQVIVLANMGAEKFASYDVPTWPWGTKAVSEVGNLGLAAPTYDPASGTLSLSLDAFQVRVFTI